MGRPFLQGDSQGLNRDGHQREPSAYQYRVHSQRHQRHAAARSHERTSTRRYRRTACSNMLFLLRFSMAERRIPVRSHSPNVGEDAGGRSRCRSSHPCLTFCCQSVGLAARFLEEAGFSSVVLTPTPEFHRIMGVPRTAAIEYPYGRPLGQVGDTDGQRQVLLAALAVLEEAEKPGEERHLLSHGPKSPRMQSGSRLK